MDLSNSLRNFLITFAAGLLLFGLVGWLIYPVINKAIFGDNEVSDTSGITQESSNDVSVTTEVSGATQPKEQKIFTAVIIGKASDGLAASVIYFRVNEETKRFSFCYIPTDVAISNSVGVDVQLKVLLSQINGDEAMKKISAVTGMRIDYYAVLGKDELTAVVKKLNNAYIDVPKEISFVNPEKAEEYDQLISNGTPTEEIPEEFFIKILQGRNNLNADLVKNLFLYKPEGSGEYHEQAKLLYEAVFTQFFTNQGTKANKSVLMSLLNDIKTTNIDAKTIDKYTEVVFNYDTYQREKIDYPKTSPSSSTYDWEKAVQKFREADGNK